EVLLLRVEAHEPVHRLAEAFDRERAHRADQRGDHEHRHHRIEPHAKSRREETQASARRRARRSGAIAIRIGDGLVVRWGSAWRHAAGGDGSRQYDTRLLRSRRLRRGEREMRHSRTAMFRPRPARLGYGLPEPRPQDARERARVGLRTPAAAGMRLTSRPISPRSHSTKSRASASSRARGETIAWKPRPTEVAAPKSVKSFPSRMYCSASVMRPSATPWPRSAACSTWSYWSKASVVSGVSSSTPIASSHAGHDSHG